MTKSREYVEAVAARIIRELEAGPEAWRKMWNAGPDGQVSGLPFNAHSGNTYNGMNIITGLWAQAKGGYAQPAFVTYKQAQAMGGQVRKGEKSTHSVIKVIRGVKEVEGANGETEQRIWQGLKTYAVWNVEQCDIELAPVVLPEPAERIAIAEARLAASGADIRHGGDKAYYSPGLDMIGMPQFEAFKGPEHYYATALHELTHWTGHKSRCDRDLTGGFGTKSYAFEELVAELGAAFQCAALGIEGDLRHAGYIQSWIRLLEDKPSAFMSACSKASKACEYLDTLTGTETAQRAA